MAPKKAGKEGGKDEDRVRVVVRIRPPVRKDEKFGEGSEALQYDAEKNLLFLIAKEEEREKTADPKQFVFDKVLWKDSQQHDAWEAAGIPIVNSVLEGYTGCVMCYGQTGAGKSFTLANETKGQEGVMVRAFHHIFEKQAESRDLKYDVQISYQQIYLDTITDLLNPGSSIEIREDPKSGVYVDGARWEPVTTAAEAVKVLQKGNSARATAATKMNSASSRSHAALIVRVTTTGGVRTLNGMLYLVDLAGSERVKKSGVEGAAFDEAKAINQSLTTLGRCIEVLASNKKEKPPFRESKLTRLLSNAIGGGAKTTLVVCVAPTMTDQFETTNSLDFGQQAMNVVVRAKVNASTDYGSLTASLLAQRDLKQKPIRQLEVQVLRELAPQLDEVLQLELACKRAALDVDIAEERLDATKDDLAATVAAGEAEVDADKVKLEALLEQRSVQTSELEQVLRALSDDPEIKRIHDEHDQQKRESNAKFASMQDEVLSLEGKAHSTAETVEAELSGIEHTARNLGQIAAYLLQTGAMEEAAIFYEQARAIFDGCLGGDHPKTLAWKEDLFFLVNAPAIQKMVEGTAQDLAPNAASAVQSAGWHSAATNSAPEWWMANLNDKKGDTGAANDDDDAASSWWMQNLYDMKTRSGVTSSDDAGDADFMNVIFGTPRDGTTTARGGPAFTPRGTLVALSQAHGKTGAAMSLGMPLLKPADASDAPDAMSDAQQDAVNMGFAADWIEKVFATPRGNASGEAEVEREMADAAAWLQDNFGSTTPRVAGDAGPPMFTPRRGQAVDADDAVFKAAMQATLATPRGTNAKKGVDDAPMADAVSKMFDGLGLKLL